MKRCSALLVTEELQIKTPRGSSYCSTMGLAASLEHWDAGSIPSPAQQVKDPTVGVGYIHSLDLIPGLGTSYAMGWPKEKANKQTKNTRGIHLTPSYGHRLKSLETPSSGKDVGTRNSSECQMKTQFLLGAIRQDIMEVKTDSPHHSSDVTSTGPKRNLQACPARGKYQVFPSVLCQLQNMTMKHLLLREWKSKPWLMHTILDSS